VSQRFAADQYNMHEGEAISGQYLSAERDSLCTVTASNQGGQATESEGSGE
jgi:hypothetical protein